MWGLRRHLKRFAAFAALLAFAGCSEELGPVPYRTTLVRGVVLDGGRPVRGGWIEFHPVDGTIGKNRSAPIASDGRFVAERVAVGRNAVGIVAAPVGVQKGREFHPLGTPIRRVVREQPAAPLTIDLYEEMLKQEQARPSRS